MRLPDFESFEPFVDLQKRMDAQPAATFSIKASARQITQHHFQAAETVAVPQLDGFVVHRPQSAAPQPAQEAALPENVSSLSGARQAAVIPEHAEQLAVTSPAMVRPVDADSLSASHPAHYAKLRPPRKKLASNKSRASRTLKLAAGGIVLLNLILLAAFFAYLLQPQPETQAPPKAAAPQRATASLPPPDVAPQQQPADPAPTPVAPPPAPLVQKPIMPPPQIQPQPQPELIFPEHDFTEQASDPDPFFPPQHAQAPAEEPQMLEPQAPQQVSQQPAPRPSMFDTPPPSDLPLAGGIGGVGAGWGGQGASVGRAGAGNIGAAGNMAAPSAAAGAVSKPHPNLMFRRIYVRHYVPVPPPPPEDIPGDQLPWHKP